jgi:hypothetical protein
MRYLPGFIFAATAHFCMAADPTDYCPLADGTEWIVEVKLTFPGGVTKTRTIRKRIDGTALRDGKTYTVLLLDGGNTRQEEIWMRKDVVGAYKIHATGHDQSEKRDLVFPLAVGKFWSESDAKDAAKAEVIGLENVIIGDTTYEKCFQIRTTSQNGIVDDRWIAPNFGHVKSETVYPDGTKSSATLLEFKPGKK